MSLESQQQFLEQYDIEQYERPSVAADIAVFSVMQKEAVDHRKLAEKELKILLVKRKQEPYMDQWALPGGFLRKDETLYEAARRELFEETGTRRSYLELCDVFSSPDRDPRGWILSQAFMVLVNSEDCADADVPRAGGDAKDTAWFSVKMERVSQERRQEDDRVVCDAVYRLYLQEEKLEVCLQAQVQEHIVYEEYHQLVQYQILKSEGLAFDHAQIIVCMLKQLRRRLKIDTRIAFDFLPEYFTLTDLQSVFEIVLDTELIKPNFRRKIADYVTETEKSIQNGAHRPAKLFGRNLDVFYD